MITRQKLNAMAELQKELNERGEEIFNALLPDTRYNLVEVRYHQGPTADRIDFNFTIRLSDGLMDSTLTIDVHDFLADDAVERAKEKRMKHQRRYTVVAGRLENNDDGVYENIKTRHTGLTEDQAKKLYHECRGYDFNRIEVDGIPGEDVSDELYGVKS